MIKAITLIKRSSGLTVREFQEYWRSEHSKVIAQLPGIRRYVQNHPLADNYDRCTPVYDGVAELWADNTRAFKDMAASDAYRQVQADEERFIDRASLALIITSEAVFKLASPRPGYIKYLEFLHRRKGMTVEDFQQYWLTRHGPLVLQLPSLSDYVQSPARPGGYSANHSPAFDGMSALRFESREDFQQATSSEPYVRILADRMHFLRDEEVPGLICEELVIIG